MRNRRWRRRFLRDCIVGDMDAGTIPAKYVTFGMDGARWLGVRVEKVSFKLSLQLTKGQAEREEKRRAVGLSNQP